MARKVGIGSGASTEQGGDSKIGGGQCLTGRAQSLSKSSQKQYGKFDKKSVGASPLKRDDDIVASWGDRAGILHQWRIDGAGDAAHIASPDIRASVAASGPVSFSPPKAPVGACIHA